MTNTGNYELRREFESYLSNYKTQRNGKSEEFMNYLIGWHRRVRLRDNIGESICVHLREAAQERFPKHSSPFAFLKYMFYEFPEPEELRRRFINLSIPNKTKAKKFKA